MTDARRGEIWHVDLGEPIGHEQGFARPALIVSSDGWNAHAATVTVLPLTRTRHGLPTRVEIEPSERNGLDEISYARCEDIRAVSDRRLSRRIGTADITTLSAVARVIRMFLEV